MPCLSRLAIAASLFALSSVVAAPVRADGVRDLNIIANAHDSSSAANIGPVQLHEPGNIVIRSAGELVSRSNKAEFAKESEVQKEMEAELARILHVDAIDWKKQMVLAVRGEAGTKADTIRFESLKVENRVLTIAWKVRPRPPHAGPGTPIALLLVDRFDGEVRFVPAGQK